MTHLTEVTVVIPAHDEEGTIQAILRDLRLQEEVVLDVRVVCNGSTDRTWELAQDEARSWQETAHELRVIRTQAANKPAALNTGEAIAPLREFICWLDADVRVPSRGLLSCVLELRRGARIASLRPEVTRSASWWVRTYLRAWLDLHARERVLGLGLLCARSRDREPWGPVPNLVADDLWILSRVGSGEARFGSEGGFTLRAPQTLGALVRMRSRWDRGNLESGAHGAGVLVPLRRCIRHGHRGVVYAAVGALCRLRALRNSGRGTASWESGR